MEKLITTLSAVKALRSSVGHCFEHLADGVREQGEECRTKFLQEFQEHFSNINVNFRELESMINGLVTPPAPYYLGNTTFLAQETTQDRQALYSQLVNSYKWIDKVHEHSFLANNLLNLNSLRRSYTSCSNKRVRLPFSSCNNTDPEHTDKLLSEIHLNSINTSYKVCRPFGSNAVVIVNISRVLKVAIICKGVLIEWVTVKGFEEPLDIEDLWVESQYEVFKKVQEHTHTAMLHFFSPTLPDLAVKSYMMILFNGHVIYRRYSKLVATNLKGKSKSSQKWLLRQLRDPFVERAKMMNYRCRSAFKLLEIDDKFKIFKYGDVVIDCGAAPGSWTQVAVDRTNANESKIANPKGEVLSMDIAHFHPVKGATIFGGMDFTLLESQLLLKDCLKGRSANCVLSDMAPNATGIKMLDQENITNLCYSVIGFATKISAPGAHLVIKVWDNADAHKLEKDMKCFYDKVKRTKPTSSRSDSAEFFLIAKFFKGI